MPDFYKIDIVIGLLTLILVARGCYFFILKLRIVISVDKGEWIGRFLDLEAI